MEKLGDSPAPASKSDPSVLKKFLWEVLPDYDRDRFYVSHMKKVVDWYNIIARNASFDFGKEEDASGEQEEDGASREEGASDGK